MCHTPMVYCLLSCTDLENTTNLYNKFPKYQRYASFTNGPASKEVPESAIETQPPAQKPATKCSLNAINIFIRILKKKACAQLNKMDCMLTC